LTYYQQAIEIEKSSSTDNPVNYAIGLNNVSGCYYEMKMYTEAKQYAKESLGLLEELLAPNQEELIKVKKCVDLLEKNKGGESQ